FPSLTQLKFGSPIIEGLSERQDFFPRLQPGFLLHDDEKTFTLFTVDFDTITYQKSTPAQGRIKARTTRFEALDLAQHASALLKKLNAEVDEIPTNRFYRKSSGRAEAVLLARACMANGLGELAHQLVLTAAAMRPDGGGKPAGVEGLQVALADDIGLTVMWLNVLALGQPEVSRPELLKRFRSYITTFPGGKYVERAEKETKLLEQMVLEDAEHEKLKKPFEQLTAQERITELIYQLRDQNGRQMSQPGACDIFADPRDDPAWQWGGEPANPPAGGSPATQLVVIGYDAVPQLIEHLDDVTLTRSISYGRDFYFTHEALSVGQCALAILIRISGRRFSGPNGARWYAEQWWADFQKKGEKQALIEGTVAGDDSSPHQAKRLLKKYPDVAFESIIQGAKNAKISHVRESLIYLSSLASAEKSVDFLLSELKSGPSLKTRASSGQLLAKRNHPDVIPAMIREWQQLNDDQRTPGGGLRNYDGSETIIFLLARSNNVEALQALGKDLDQRPIERRMEVILALQAFRKPVLADDKKTPAPEAKISDAVNNAVEALLAHSLEDTAQREGMSGSWGKTSYRDPRVCEFAAYVLTTLWPQDYVFDLEAPQLLRRRQLLAVKNVWRAKQKLPAIPIPELTRIDRLPVDRTKPLIAQIVGTSETERDQAIQELLSLGLPALPAVMEALKAVPEGKPAHAHLQGLSSRLGCVVSEIELEQGSIAPDAMLQKHIDELRNQPLTRSAITEFVKTASGSLPKGADTIKFLAERIDDQRGIHLTIGILAKLSPQRSKLGGVEWTEQVELGGKPLCGITGGISRMYGGDEKVHTTFYKCVDQALSAAADIRLFIQIKVTADR
ncbi:MAG: hypothetical protein JWN70_6901, partial [Planctomycetaceae bacterium]|nr:hypothetical protein [Planctomycetaceae bacterium]